MEIQAQEGAWLMLQLQNWQDGKFAHVFQPRFCCCFMVPLYYINIDPRDKNGHPGPARRKLSWFLGAILLTLATLLWIWLTQLVLSAFKMHEQILAYLKFAVFWFFTALLFHKVKIITILVDMWSKSRASNKFDNTSTLSKKSFILAIYLMY